MMRGFRSMVLLMVPALAAALMTGCAPEPVKQTVAPAPVIITASPEQAMDAKEDILKFSPGVKIGRVSGVKPSDALASVSDISAADVKVGDTIVFADGRQTPVATGTIEFIFKADGKDYAVDTLVVEYKASMRPPSKGDLAILLKDKAQ